MSMNQQPHPSTSSASGGSTLTANGLDMTLPSPHHLFSITAAAAAMNGSHQQRQSSPTLNDLVNSPLHHVQTQLGSASSSSDANGASSSIGAGIGAQAQMQLLALQQRHQQMLRSSSSETSQLGHFGNKKSLESKGEDMQLVKIESSDSPPTHHQDSRNQEMDLTQENDNASQHSNSCDDVDSVKSDPVDSEMVGGKNSNKSPSSPGMASFQEENNSDR